MTLHTKKSRKALGAYYTPTSLSKVLCDWGIRSSDNLVFEPSFGGCGFLESSVSRLSELGCSNPISRIYGADIDARAFDYLSEMLGDMTNINGQFVHKDFIKISPSEFSEPSFDSVLGNPPYVSMHNMTEEQKVSCFNLLRESPYARGTIGRNASLWAFFLLHSLSFIKEGGRVAWVLPSSLLHADYARELLKVYSCHFELVKVIKLSERYFQSDDADEVSVILFADGFSAKESAPVKVGYAVADDVSELSEITKDISLKSVSCENYKHALFDAFTLEAFQRISTEETTTSIDMVAKIVIGMVTGDNGTFIVDKETVENYGLDDRDLKPVIGRFFTLKGLLHNSSRQKRIQNEGAKSFLVCPESIDKKHSAIRSYLSRIPAKKRKNNRTFRKRAAWYFPDDGRYPDAFLTYMIDRSPRLVINSARVNCTNSVHRVFFNKGISFLRKKAISVSLLSSFSQLSAELQGRAYGSGVLKLEPSAAKRIQFLLDDNLEQHLVENFNHIDALISNNKLEEAQFKVDEIISKSTGLPLSTLQNFAQMVRTLRDDRYKGLHESIN
ncbi:N-6 DNA methylase [Vibrio campbellii]|uniref:N-6 DNA methylase n=1 Tax=Vibrio campbellii TaxID=680 RepID=UPI001E64D554|nr:N-6 DNA methylase [Vibrio campbellii]MCC8252678.1 SAM-dependent methyltransferase [Vibrio campbellii CAIM 333]